MFIENRNFDTPVIKVPHLVVLGHKHTNKKQTTLCLTVAYLIAHKVQLSPISVSYPDLEYSYNSYIMYTHFTALKSHNFYKLQHFFSFLLLILLHFKSCKLTQFGVQHVLPTS